MWFFVFSTSVETLFSLTLLHGGARYFECKHSSADGALPGSFVRVHKIRPSLTFLQAVQAKYTDAATAKKTDAAIAAAAAAAAGEDGGGGGGSDAVVDYALSARGQKISIELCLKKVGPGSHCSPRHTRRMPCN
jgi:hypothetical protein